MIYVLTYDHPHKKTQDVLFRMKALGYDEVTVLATEWLEMGKRFKPLISHKFKNAIPVEMTEFVKRIGYNFNLVPTGQLKEYLDQYEPAFVLLAGAGLLPAEIVENHKIINAHPGYLPYARGLDETKWAIWNNLPLGVTTHIIDDRIDAGMSIRREVVPIYTYDTFHSVAYRIYETEIKMLVSAIEDVNSPEGMMFIGDSTEPTRCMPHRLELMLLQKFEQYKMEHAI